MNEGAPAADATDGALHAVRRERMRQHALWGHQRHTWPEWIGILTEEVGEAAQAANKTWWNDAGIGPLREELVQVAAVAVAIVEHLDEVMASAEADQAGS